MGVASQRRVLQEAVQSFAKRTAIMLGLVIVLTVSVRGTQSTVATLARHEENMIINDETIHAEMRAAGARNATRRIETLDESQKKIHAIFDEKKKDGSSAKE